MLSLQVKEQQRKIEDAFKQRQEKIEDRLKKVNASALMTRWQRLG